MNANEIIKYCMGLSERELVKFAKENYKIVFDYLRVKADEKKARVLINGCIVTCVSVDGRFTQEEWDFVKKVADGYATRTYAETKSIIQEFYNDIDEAGRVTSELTRYFPQEVKDAQIKLCLAVASVDKNVERKEADLLNRILGVQQ